MLLLIKDSNVYNLIKGISTFLPFIKIKYRPTKLGMSHLLYQKGIFEPVTITFKLTRWVIRRVVLFYRKSVTYSSLLAWPETNGKQLHSIARKLHRQPAPPGVVTSKYILCRFEFCVTGTTDSQIFNSINFCKLQFFVIWKM